MSIPAAIDVSIFKHLLLISEEIGFMTIKQLRECPQFIERVIELINDEFGDTNSRNFYKSIIEHSLIKDQIPITFVAVEGDQLLGTVGIWRGDLLSRQDLFPWLAALVVHPGHRRSGIGQELQNYVLTYCRSRSMKDIYLYTELKGYYEKSGWVRIDSGYECAGNEVSIYKHTL